MQRFYIHICMLLLTNILFYIYNKSLNGKKLKIVIGYSLKLEFKCRVLYYDFISL